MLLLLVAACSASQPATPTTIAPTPSPIIRDGTPPRDVLEVFLKTLVIGDCAASRELSTPAGFMQVGGLCGRIHVVNFSIVGDGTSLTANAMRFATTLTVEGGDDVLPDGDHTIFFSVGREPNGPWRVTGGGSGP